MKALTLKQILQINTTPKAWVCLVETDAGYVDYYTNNPHRYPNNIHKRGYLIGIQDARNHLAEYGNFYPNEMFNIKTK